MSLFEINPVFNTDSYKLSQFLQLPAGSEFLYSMVVARGGNYEEIVNFGIQSYCKQYLQNVPTKGQVRRAAKYAQAHGLEFNYDGWMQLVELGYYPINIMSLPEGTVVPNKTCIAAVENTHADFAWLVDYIETSLLRAVWYSSTVATLSYRVKSMLNKYAVKMGLDPSIIDFKLHNFGDRGASSSESAYLAGMAHLTSFLGTDCFMALDAVEHFYNFDFENDGVAGFSVNASQHSTITSWENEIDAFENMILKFGGFTPDGRPKIVACVSDSYNIWKALEYWKMLEDEIIESGCVLVIRPDSGCPIKTPVNVIKRLIELFGYTEHEHNGKMFKTLPSYIRVIQGDGVSEVSIGQILENMYNDGLSLENIAFGMGGELTQKTNRDTCKWAMKGSHISGVSEVENDGEVVIETFSRGFNKNPIGTSHWEDTPSGESFKSSFSGKVCLMLDDDGNYVQELLTPENKSKNLLKTVFKDGIMVVDEHFNTIRSRINDKIGL